MFWCIYKKTILKIKKFICDIDYDSIKDSGENYFVTKNNEIYSVSFDKLFSNNQNCKKSNIDTKIKVIKGDFVLDKDNKSYLISSDSAGISLSGLNDGFYKFNGKC